MRKLLLALLVVAVIAAPAFASVQNIKISGSVQTDVIHRSNFDFNGTPNTEEDLKQNLLRSYVTIQLDADLSDNVAATIQLMNERVWDAVSETVGGTNDGTQVNLNLAYVTLREMLYSPMTVVVGRQNFPIGNQLLFDGGTSGEAASDLYGNVGNSNMDATDAIRFIFDYNPLTLQAFYAVVNAGTKTYTTAKDKAKLYGLVATYLLGDERNTLLEGVFLSRKTQESSASATRKTDIVNTVSLRASSNIIPDKFNTSVEIAHQSGVYANPFDATNNRTRDAWAFQVVNTTGLPFEALEQYSPIIQLTFTKLTGDSSISNLTGNDDKVWTGWDPMYEGQTKNHNSIAGALFTLSNALIYNASLQVTPMEDVISKLSVTKLYLQQPWQGTVSGYEVKGTPDFAPSSYMSTLPTNKGESYIGLEVMLENTYNYTEDVQFGLSATVFKPGKVFKYRNYAKQILGSVKVSF